MPNELDTDVNLVKSRCTGFYLFASGSYESYVSFKLRFPSDSMNQPRSCFVTRKLPSSPPDLAMP